MLDSMLSSLKKLDKKKMPSTTTEFKKITTSIENIITSIENIFPNDKNYKNDKNDVLISVFSYLGRNEIPIHPNYIYQKKEVYNFFYYNF